MATRIGKGFSIKGDKIVDHRHKLGSKSDQIKRAKSRKPKAVGRMKAMMVAQKAR